MYSTIDGRLATTLDGEFIETKVDTLSYMMKGAYFPKETISVFGRITFESTEPQTVTVSYADSESDTYSMVQVNGIYKIGWVANDGETSDLPNGSRKPKHIYQDSNTGLRTVSIKFEKPLSVISVNSERIAIYGTYPTEIGSFKNLESFNSTFAQYISKIPESLGKLKKLKTLIFQYNTLDRALKIPDAFFELTSLGNLTLDGSFDLSDPISSNFFKINQLINLTKLALASCKIITLPNEFYQLENLSDLRLNSNMFLEYPTGIAGFESIRILYLGFDNSNSGELEWGDLTNYKKLNIAIFGYKNFNLQAIPEDWKYLYSLNKISDFTKFIDTDARFDEFVNVFYELITNEASLTSGGSAAPYPNRFRDISWGDTSLTFSGIYEAPSGYIQGVSNGNPVTEGQRVYVLVEQYGHTVTSAN